MRKAILLSALLLLPAVWADSSEIWLIEVEDMLGNPVDDCDVYFTDPWTGAVTAEPNGAMYQPSAICEGYVVLWHEPIASSQNLVVLSAYPIIEDLFEVNGAHTISAMGSSWSIAVENGSVDAPQIPLIVVGKGGSEVRISQSEITIPNITNSYNLSGEYNASISVKAIHTGSGEIIDWQNDQNLTVGEYGSGWTARVYHQGLPIGVSSWPPSSTWIYEQINSTVTTGMATLSFIDSLSANQEFNATWNAEHIFSTGLGLPFMPNAEAGIESQINRYLSGDVSRLEMIIETIIYQNGMESLCCEVDHNTVGFSNLVVNSEINLSSDIWGWSESATVNGQRSHLDLIRIDVPFQNDLRQMTPLNIVTDGTWQYLSSPLYDWIGGHPSNFTLQRNEVSITGLYTITLGQNEAPLINLSEEYALDWRNTSYEFVPVISDAPLSIHDCTWNIGGLSENNSVNLSQFSRDYNLSVSVSCIDEGGMEGWWNESFILDDEDPWINATDLIQEIYPGTFSWDLMVGDDNDDNLRVYWTSNKTLDWWYTGDLLETSFYADSSVNTISDNITERHKAREPVEYWLSAEVTDDAGHTTVGNWTIRLIDNNGPVILHQLQEYDGNDWQLSTNSKVGEKLRLDLTESFDDYSAVENLTFNISLPDRILAESISWEEAQFFELPELGVGYHLLHVLAVDDKGNMGGDYLGIPINPPDKRNLEIVEIKYSGEDLSPGDNQFWVVVQNHGALTTPFTVCSGKQCIDSEVLGSTFVSNGTISIPINVELGWFETFSVNLAYPDDDNNTVVKNYNSEFETGPGISSLELIAIVFVMVLGIMWLRSRNQSRV